MLVLLTQKDQVAEGVARPVGAVIGEFVASNRGLGYALIQAVGSLDTTYAFAAVIIISVFGVGIWYLAELVEKLSIPWHASQR